MRRLEKRRVDEKEGYALYVVKKPASLPESGMKTISDEILADASSAKLKSSCVSDSTWRHAARYGSSRYDDESADDGQGERYFDVQPRLTSMMSASLRQYRSERRDEGVIPSSCRDTPKFHTVVGMTRGFV